MSDDITISRRSFAAGLALLSLAPSGARAQGYAGLGSNADGYAAVTPGRTFSFPADHAPHPDFRIEWWYLTANLRDGRGTAYGVQWTLFRQAMAPGPQREGWSNQQIWMAHAAATRADSHRFSQCFARGGVGEAGVELDPFRAFIDAWAMRGRPATDAERLAPLALTAAGQDFSYDLTLDADRPLVLQGDGGFSLKSERGQASYYYSQPFFKANGRLVIDDNSVDVAGLAWMDREWSSQPLAADQTGWDWFALHLASGDKVMLYRMRQKNGGTFISGTFIPTSGDPRQLGSADVEMTPRETVEIVGRKLPVQWDVTIRSLELAVQITPLNPRAWMGTGFSYWEGPISLTGTHAGVGYLELTGY